MATHLLACDGSLLSHYPSLMTAVSLSSISYALHVSVALATLVILSKKLITNYKNRRLITYLLFVIFLLVMGTAHLSVYLATRTICNRKLRTANYDARLSLVKACIAESRLPVPVPGDTIPPVCWALTDPNPSTSNWETEYITGHRYFKGPDLNRAQDLLALGIAILAQFYLVVRCHRALGRKVVTAAMTVLLSTAIGFGIAQFNILPADIDPSQPIEIPTFVLRSFMSLSHVYWSLTLTFNICVNVLIVGRLIWLRRPLRLAAGNESESWGSFFTRWAEMLLDPSLAVAAVFDSGMVYTVVLIIAWSQSWMPVSGGVENHLQPMVVQTQAIVVEIIIMRTALGWAFPESSEAQSSVTGNDREHAPLLGAE